MKKAKCNLLYKNIKFFNKYLLITISILIVITSGITSYAAFSLQLSGNQNISIKVKDYKLPEVTTVSTSKTGTIINPKVTIRATVTDNVGIVGYQVTESNIAPTTWTTISSTTSTTISKDVSVAKTYYFWVKDQAGNISITKSLVVTTTDLDYFSDCFAYTQTTTEVTITDYKCYAGNTYGYPTITDVTIPAKLNNKNVINIGSSAFSTNGLTKVTIPTTLKTIGSSAFQNNKLVGTLVIPASVTTIGDWAFSSSDKTSYNKLTGLTFQSGSNLTSIGGTAFLQNNISSLSTFNYLTKLQTIGVSAFENNNLTGTLIIPASVTTIGSWAFSSSDKTSYNKLTGLTFQSGSSLTSIGTNAFRNNNIGSLSTFNYLIKLQTVGNAAFQENNLTGTLIIPVSVITIGEWAFATGYKNTYNKLTGLTFQSGSNLTSIGDCAFRNTNISSLSTFNYLTKLQTIGAGAFQSNNITGALVIPASVTTIGDLAFYSYSKNTQNVLTGLTFQSGSNLTSIGIQAFYRNNISSLSTFNYLTKLQTIGWGTFENNNIAGSLVIPASVTSIASTTFAINQLTSLTIPNSVTSIGFSAFQDNQLTSLTIPNSVTSIGNYSFHNNKLANVTIGTGVKTIEYSAFQDNKLTSVTIGTGVTTIEGSVFANNQLTTVTIPANVTTIGTYAFHKNDISNPGLIKIINRTGRSFAWDYITWGYATAPFVTGVLSHSYGNITITAS